MEQLELPLKFEEFRILKLQNVSCDNGQGYAKETLYYIVYGYRAAKEYVRSLNLFKESADVWFEIEGEPQT